MTRMEKGTLDLEAIEGMLKGLRRPAESGKPIMRVSVRHLIDALATLPQELVLLAEEVPWHRIDDEVIAESVLETWRKARLTSLLRPIIVEHYLDQALSAERVTARAAGRRCSLMDLVGPPTVRLEFDQARALRGSVVYAWVRGPEVLYVGQSTVGIGRPLSNQHDALREMAPGDELLVWRCAPGEADEVETCLIGALKPVRNKAKKGSLRARRRRDGRR